MSSRIKLLFNLKVIKNLQFFMYFIKSVQVFFIFNVDIFD